MNRLCSILLAATALTLVAARHPHGGGGESPKSGPAPERQPDVFPPPGSIPNGGAASANHAGPTSAPTAAQFNNLRQAQADLDDVVKKLRAKYEADPAFAAALAVEKQARAEYDAAAKKAAGNVATDPAYVKAQADLKTAEADLDATRNDSSKQDQLPAKAMAAMQARDALHEIEARARASDPAVAAAEAKRAAAANAVAKLRAKYEADMINDPDYQAAEKALTDAKSAVGSH